jgi:hypothetical protein
VVITYLAELQSRCRDRVVQSIADNVLSTNSEAFAKKVLLKLCADGTLSGAQYSNTCATFPQFADYHFDLQCCPAKIADKKTMSTMTAVMNEVEWRTASAASVAGESFSLVVRRNIRSDEYIKILQVSRKMKSLYDAMDHVIKIFHREDLIVALEAADDETRLKIGRQLKDLVDKIHDFLASTRHIKAPRLIKNMFKSRFELVQSANGMLGNHADSLLDTNSALIFLSEADQNQMLEALYKD